MCDYLYKFTGVNVYDFVSQKKSRTRIKKNNVGATAKTKLKKKISLLKKHEKDYLETQKKMS